MSKSQSNHCPHRLRLLPILLLFACATGSAQPAESVSYTRIRRARHQTYVWNLTLAPDPTPGAPAELDLVIGHGSGDTPHARLLWTTAGFRLERRFPDTTLDTLLTQGTTPVPHTADGPLELMLRRAPRWIEVVADGRRLCRVLDGQVGAGDLATAATATGFAVQDVGYQRLEPFVFGDDFMRTEEEAAELGLWEPVSGDWRLYSVMEMVRENPDARIRTGHEPQAERSANPFSLAGSDDAGATAMIVAGYPFWHDYSFAVSAKTTGGTFGLAFAIRAPDNYWAVRWHLDSPALTPGRLQLIRVSPAGEQVVDEVDAVGRTGSWYRLGVRQQGSDVRATLDGVQVLAVNDPHCVGGRVGLITDSASETVFDDVDVASVAEVPIRDETTWQTGTAPVRGEWGLEQREGGEDEDAGAAYLQGRPGAGDEQPALLLVGEATRQADSIELTSAHTNSAANGFVFDFQDPANYAWATRDPGQGVWSHGRTNAGVSAPLQTVTVPGMEPAARLILDLNDPEVFEVFENGVLVLRGPRDQGGGNAAGLLAHGPVVYSDLALSAPDRRDWEKPGDIEAFLNDPYMQAWASPRGAWLPVEGEDTPTDGRRYFVHRSDTYGAFDLRLPLSHDLSIYLGADEALGETACEVRTRLDAAAGTGTLTLTRNGASLAEADFALPPPGQAEGDRPADTRPVVGGRSPGPRPFGTLRVVRDGHYVYAEIAEHNTLVHRFDAIPEGRGLGLGVRGHLDLLHVELQRDHIKDYLFEHAPVDWTPVGTWEVTNRFSCDPRWSHMNGQSKGVAALWNKYVFEGDFTLEFYAGMRMRQAEMREENENVLYPRVGDINASLATAAGDLFSGYTLMLAAWDPDWSETWSRFWREDQVAAETDRELIPRTRDQNPTKRAIPVPWDPGGRPLHGAWYHIKIRKTGDRCRTWFDGFPVFDYTDPSPLAARQVALWTQQNSIVVARAKVGYRTAAIPTAYVTPVTAPVSVTPTPDPLPALESGSHPGAFFDFEDGPQGWTPYADDQSAVCRTVTVPQGGTALRLRNAHAGGDFGVLLPIQGLDLARTARLEMDCRIPDGVKVNLYVRLRENPRRYVFVTMTGPAEPEVDRVRLGAFESLEVGDAWQHLQLDIGLLLRNRFPEHDSFVVEEAVIGMLHQGYLNAGLGGNAEGAAWDLDNFSLTGCGGLETRFALAGQEALPEGTEVRFSDDYPGPGSLDAAAAGAALPGLGYWFAVAVERTADGRLRHASRPLRVCAAPPLELLSIEPPDGSSWGGETIVLRFRDGLPARLDRKAARLGIGQQPPNAGLDPPMAGYDPVTRTLRLDLVVPGRVPDGMEWALALKAADNRGTDDAPVFHWQYTFSNAHDRTPPSAVYLEDERIIEEDFESGMEHHGAAMTHFRSGTGPFVWPVEPTSAWDLVPWNDGREGHYLCVENQVVGRRFGVTLAHRHWSMNVGTHPLLDFDYSASRYARVNLVLHSRGENDFTVRMTDNDAEGTVLLKLPGATGDDQWRHAELQLGRLIGEATAGAFEPEVYQTAPIMLEDQGHRAVPPGAKLRIDNVRFTPCISTAGDGLQLRWKAHDLSGIAGIGCVWSAEPEVELPDTITTTASPVTFTDVPEGLRYLNVRARDNNGNWGPVRSHRFAVDNTAPVLVELEPDDGTWTAGRRVALRFDSGVAAIDPATIQLRMNGARCALSRTTATWDAAAGLLEWDWVSARRWMQEPIPHGTRMEMALVQVQDFAGNVTPAMEWSWTVDHEADESPPEAPRLACYTQNLAHYDSFTDDVGTWGDGRGFAQAELELVEDRTRADRCLELRAPIGAERFGAIPYSGELDPEEFPVLAFDYRLDRGCRVNLYLSVNNTWRCVRMNGDPAGTEVVHEIPDAVDDGAWRHAHVDLKAVTAGLEEEEPRIAMVYLGEMRRENIPGMRFRVDNFALAGHAAPMPVVTCRAADETGISAFRVGFSQDPYGEPERELEPGATQVMLDAADVAGLWFVHARARDGAGNWGPVTHYPYLAPTPLATLPEGWEADAGWEIAASRNRDARVELARVKGVTGHDQALGLRVTAGRAAGVAVSRELDAELGPDTVVRARIYNRSSNEIRAGLFFVEQGTGQRFDTETVVLQPEAWTDEAEFRIEPSARTRMAGKTRMGGVGLNLQLPSRTRGEVLINSLGPVM